MNNPFSHFNLTFQPVEQIDTHLQAELNHVNGYPVLGDIITLTKVPVR